MVLSSRRGEVEDAAAAAAVTVMVLVLWSCEGLEGWSVNITVRSSLPLALTCASLVTRISSDVLLRVRVTSMDIAPACHCCSAIAWRNTPTGGCAEIQRTVMKAASKLRALSVFARLLRKHVPYFFCPLSSSLFHLSDPSAFARITTSCIVSGKSGVVVLDFQENFGWRFAFLIRYVLQQTDP